MLLAFICLTVSQQIKDDFPHICSINKHASYNRTALPVKKASSALSLPVVKTGSTLCLISHVCIKYANPIPDRPYKHEIHFPSGIKVMSPFHTNTATDGSDNTALWGRACIQRCFEDVLKVPSPCFPTICTAFWASGLNPAEPHRWAQTSEGGVKCHSWNALFGFGWCLLRGKKWVLGETEWPPCFHLHIYCFTSRTKDSQILDHLYYCDVRPWYMCSMLSDLIMAQHSKFLTCWKGNECKGAFIQKFHDIFS